MVRRTNTTSTTCSRHILLASYKQLSEWGTFGFLVPCMRKLYSFKNSNSVSTNRVVVMVCVARVKCIQRPGKSIFIRLGALHDMPITPSSGPLLAKSMLELNSLRKEGWLTDLTLKVSFIISNIVFFSYR